LGSITSNTSFKLHFHEGGKVGMDGYANHDADWGNSES
jgi:hypothetical protein